MKMWFDTEFIEDGKTIELISIGIVAEDGREYYAELCGEDGLPPYCHIPQDHWVIKNVVPHLQMRNLLTRSAVAKEIKTFVCQQPEFWAYYADYDWVALCQLFGRMIDLPKDWPQFCLDVQQLAVMAKHSGAVITLPPKPPNSHNALADAKWTKLAWEVLAYA
jgi:hypothetical protein